MKLKSDGQVAYEAYCASTNGVSLISGAKLPEFGGLSEAVKAAWEAAGAAVARSSTLRERIVDIVLNDVSGGGPIAQAIKRLP